MGKEVLQHGDKVPLENRPGVLVIGSSNVGKRTLLSRLLEVNLSDASDLSTEVLCHGWVIDTKYYTADLAIWMVHLDEGFSLGSLPNLEQLTAVVMVFDMSELSSFAALQDWVSGSDVQRFEILLCVGNKTDLVPGHFAHRVYRRKLQKSGESSADPHPEYLDYGIFETEASSLLGDEEPSWETKRSCAEWCSQNNIEFVEACASNAVFDKCLSVNGDSQGVDRIYGALSAHMWPGMVLKSGIAVNESVYIEKEDFSEGESDYEIEYERLSGGSAESWDAQSESCDGPQELASAIDREHQTDDPGSTQASTSKAEDGAGYVDKKHEAEAEAEDQTEAASCHAHLQKDYGTTCSESKDQRQGTNEADAQTSEPVEVHPKPNGTDEDICVGMEDMEQLMCEISNMRENLRLMPDFQRREMAAKLAMKMAVMFGDGSGEEGFE